MFELADEEFIGIRDQRRALQKQAAEALSMGNTAIPLSAASILEFCNNWSKVPTIRDQAEKAGFRWTEYTEEDGLIGDIYKWSKKLKLQSISDLQASLAEPKLKFFRVAIDRYRVLENDAAMAWYMSSDFAVLVLLIANNRYKISRDDLIGDGWGDSNANAIHDAIDAAWPE